MKLPAALLLTALCAGCATKYQPDGFTGGYSETQLNADTFQIAVAGNGYTSRERAGKIAMLRASDLTLTRGEKRFVVISDSVVSELSGAMQTSTTITPIFKPSGNLTIRIVRASDPAFATALDAALIAAQLRPQLQ